MKAKIIDLIDETADVRTFRLDAKVDFIPGQYCLVSSPDDENQKRPFTFTSSPTEAHTDFTIKKMKEFTSRLFELKVGDSLIFANPKGTSLNFNESVSQDVVFIAGGSGITPFISALRYAKAKNLKNNITLINCNRTKNDIIYYDELLQLNKLDNITIVNALTKESPANWQEELGRINKDMVLKYVTNPEEKLWYACAPPPMVKAVKDLLTEMEIPKDNWRIEDWEMAGKHDNES